MSGYWNCDCVVLKKNVEKDNLFLVIQNEKENKNTKYFDLPTHVLRNAVFQKSLKIYVKNTVKLIEYCN